MSGRYSRERGKRGERMWRDVLREAGYLKSYRGQQYSGSGESPDVVCPELPSIHWEVKNTEKLNVYDALAQALEDCGSRTPIVAHKRNHFPWVVILRATDFLEIVKQSDLVKSSSGSGSCEAQRTGAAGALGLPGAGGRLP